MIKTLGAALVVCLIAGAARAEDAPATPPVLAPSRVGEAQFLMLKNQRNAALDAVVGCYGDVQGVTERATAAEAKAAALQKRVDDLEKAAPKKPK